MREVVDGAPRTYRAHFELDDLLREEGADVDRCDLVTTPEGVPLGLVRSAGRRSGAG